MYVNQPLLPLSKTRPANLTPERGVQAGWGVKDRDDGSLSLSLEDNLKGIMDQPWKWHLNLPYKIKQTHINRAGKVCFGRMGLHLKHIDRKWDVVRGGMRLERYLCLCVCVCVCLRVTRVIGRGCLPRGNCWPHTQALPRQRCVVNNRRAMTEGRHTQTQISIKVKDGCGCNGRALYRHVINTWGGFTKPEREGAGRRSCSRRGPWHLHIKCMRGLYVSVTVQSIWFQPPWRVRWLPPHLLTLHDSHHSYKLLTQWVKIRCDNNNNVVLKNPRHKDGAQCFIIFCMEHLVKLLVE